MKKDSGFIEFNAVLVLFFIAVIVSGGVLYATSAMIYLQTDIHDFNDKQAADTLLDEIIDKLQPLRLYLYDDKNNDIITSLCREYDNYKLEITDVSSGYHLDFLSDTDMADSNITKLLFTDSSGSAFSAWQNANGLSTTKTAWKEFVKEEAWDACVSYGWVHKTDIESFAYKSISKSFAVTSLDKLFPLVNEFPRMNVNMVTPDILRPLIMRGSFKIEKPNEKADALINRLNGGSVLHADISSILNVPINHPIMDYFGTKTTFWKLSFTMPSTIEIEAIVVAIPKKNGAVQEIEEYRLIDRSFIDD